MTRARRAQGLLSVQGLNSIDKYYYTATFLSAASSAAVSKTTYENDTWNIETIWHDDTADKQGNKLDFDWRFPESGEVDVFVSGAIQEEGVDYDITEHGGSNDFTITFTRAIGDDEPIVFSL